MWPTLTIFAGLGLVALHLWWKRRLDEARAKLEEQTGQNAVLHEQQQLALAQAQAQQQALFNSMVEGVLLLDGNGRVRLVNQALEHLFGLKGDIRGRTTMEALRLHELQELVSRVRVEGQVLGFELELPGLDNRCLQVNATGLLDRGGMQQGMILVFHDLTRLKQLENTRQEFVANVSHELRTPLSMIKGYVETLINGAKDDPNVATRFLRTIEKHADRLTYLIEDLLTISRLESGQIVLNLQKVGLRSVAEDVMEDLQSRAGDKKVNLENQVPDDVVVRADADRVQQVIFNLVDNAIKYGRPEGNVWINARLAGGEFAEVSVRDNGPGIPPDSIDRVFERFYRADKARSREQGGTGLGLSIVKHIVQSHGGEVWVESELGRGTSFFFTLPLT
ncbi:MAG: PAS domain-containing sensor histidine kinase [Verrucomicrobia bacterium]|nr:MAG: PAS domain-containing sensor histidine kinase [Verrucomicrobiota bacterium]